MPRRARKADDPDAIGGDPWRARLRRYRFTHNIKQAALAADLGVTQAMVSRWESGVVTPSAEMQRRIMALFDDDTVSVPLIDWRSHTAAQPGIAGVVDRAGMIETASVGLLRLLGRDRGEIDGKRLDDVFDGGPPELFQTLLSAGFFDGRLESVESADLYSFVDGSGQMTSCCIEGLHWPHRGENGDIRWMLSGARIGADDYEALCREMAGKVTLVTSR
jgi:transcriptional regulator with XRE-family HTH domain